MSWSFSCIGKAAKVAEAIEKYGETLSGQSQAEFLDAKPHLIGLVAQNYITEEGVKSGWIEGCIDFEASGSGSTKDGKDAQRSCTVSIRPLWKTMV
jgi:hypothetical protein